MQLPIIVYIFIFIRKALANTICAHVAYNGFSIPCVGFGTAALGEKTVDAVRLALDAGITHVDTAQADEWYREGDAGLAILQHPNKENVIVTTKLHPRDHGFQRTLKKVEDSLQNLHRSTIDVFLLHFPECWKDLCGDARPEGTWEDSWRALETLYEKGVLSAIGVSNFHVSHLERLLEVGHVAPMVVQNFMDVFHQDKQVRAFCRKHGIIYVAYSVLGRRKRHVLEHPVILRLAEKYNVEATRLVFSWALQEGVCIIPRSATKDHIESNARLLRERLEISREDMEEIASLDMGR